MPKYYSYKTYHRSSTVGSKKTTLLMQGFSASMTLFVVSIVILAGLYVFITNASVVRGSQIHALEKDIHTYELENTELDIQLAQMSTRQYIAQTITQQQMEPINDPMYITPSDKRVAILTADK